MSLDLVNLIFFLETNEDIAEFQNTLKNKDLPVWFLNF